MRWVIYVVLIVLLTASAVAFNLENYPSMFIDPTTNAFTGYIVIGDNPTSQENDAASDIASQLPTAQTISALRHPDISLPTITIGCDNTVTLSYLRYPDAQTCRDSVPHDGMIRIQRSLTGNPQVIVVGSTDFGTQMAARVLQNRNYLGLSGTTVHVLGTSLSIDEIQIIPERGLPISGTLDLSFANTQPLPLGTGVSSTHVDAGTQLEFSQAGQQLGYMGISFSSAISAISPGAYTFDLLDSGVPTGYISFTYNSGQVEITNIQFNIIGSDVSQWIPSGGAVSKIIELKMDDGTPRGDFTIIFTIYSIEEGFLDFTNQGVLLGAATVTVDSTVPDPIDNNLANFFKGRITNTQGAPVGGVLVALLGDTIFSFNIQTGDYFGRIIGPLGEPINFLWNGNIVGSSTIQDTSNYRELNFVVDPSQKHYADEDHDSIPDALDRCPGTVESSVNAQGCSCEQLDCPGKCSISITEFSSRPICSESCFDGIMNQDETGMDCGGSCGPCLTCDTPEICMTDSPQFCTSDLTVVNNCATCGCPLDFQCDSDGQCYQEVELQNLICKVNDYEVGTDIDCATFNIQPDEVWVELMGPYGLDEEQARTLIADLRSLVGAEDFKQQALQQIQSYSLASDIAGYILDQFQTNFFQKDFWHQEKVSDYVHINVHGLPSLAAQRYEDKANDIVDKWKACIRTKQSCVQSGTPCDSASSLTRRQEQIKNAIKKEVTKRIRGEIPSLGEFLGVSLSPKIDVSRYSTEVPSTATCEPARITPLSGCKNLISNGPSEQKADLLFIGDGFFTESGFRQIISELLDYEGQSFDTDAEGFFSREPLKSIKAKFNIWYIMADGRIQYFEDEDDPSLGVRASDDDLYSLQSFCPHADYTVLLANRGFRSYCYFGTPCVVSMLAEAHPGRLLTHELGHGIGSLEDEYYHFLESRDDPNVVEDLHFNTGPNCMANEQEAQVKWAGLNGISFFEGCGGDCGEQCASYVRPTYNSIMRYQSWKRACMIDAIECQGPPFDDFYAVNEYEILNALSQFS